MGSGAGRSNLIGFESPRVHRIDGDARVRKRLVSLSNLVRVIAGSLERVGAEIRIGRNPARKRFREPEEILAARIASQKLRDRDHRIGGFIHANGHLRLVCHLLEILKGLDGRRFVAAVLIQRNIRGAVGVVLRVWLDIRRRGES